MKIVNTIAALSALWFQCAIANYSSYKEFEEKIYHYIPALPCNAGLSISRRTLQNTPDFEVLSLWAEQVEADIKCEFRQKYTSILSSLYKPVLLEDRQHYSLSSDDINQRFEQLTMNESCVRSLKRAHAIATIQDDELSEDRILLYSDKGHLLASTSVQGSAGELDLESRMRRQLGCVNGFPWLMRGCLQWRGKKGSAIIAGYNNTMLIFDYHSSSKKKDDEKVVSIPHYNINYVQFGGNALINLDQCARQVNALHMTSETSFLIAWGKGKFEEKDDCLELIKINLNRENHPMYMTNSFARIGSKITHCCGVEDNTFALFVVDNKDLRRWNFNNNEIISLLEDNERKIKHIDVHPFKHCFVVVFEKDLVQIYNFHKRRHIWKTEGYLARFDSMGNLIVVQDLEDNRASIRRYYCPIPGDFSFMEEMMYTKARQSKVAENILNKTFLCAPIKRRRANT